MPNAPDQPELAVPVSVFGRSLKGGPDEVYLRLLATRHPNARYIPSKWQSLIEQYRTEPAHPAHPQYRGNPF